MADPANSTVAPAVALPQNRHAHSEPIANATGASRARRATTPAKTKNAAPAKGETYAMLRSPTARKAIEQQIETLIAILDDADGDPDLEDEPDAEWTTCSGAHGYAVDAELDTSDVEPSFGWTDTEAMLDGQTSRMLPEDEHEADYFIEHVSGLVTTHEANEEDQFGCPPLVLPNGEIINDREATDCGYYPYDGRRGSYDDHGIGDDGGRCEQYAGFSAHAE